MAKCNAADITNTEVAEIASLAELQLKSEATVAALEDELKQAKARLRQVSEIDLPNAMKQAGISGITLPNGKKVGIKDEIYASIPASNYHEALDWLREHGFGDVIKNEVTVSFGKGEEAQANACINELLAHGWKQFSQDMKVHPGTLKALLKEQLAEGKDVPLELFGAMPVSKAVIK